MIYVTQMQKREPKQVSWEDVILQKATVEDFDIKNFNTTGTITRKFEICEVPENVDAMIQKLHVFNEKYKDLRLADKSTLYTHFTIPKKTGGLRPIDAPVTQLQDALGELAELLKSFGLLYHTSAFAYIKDRSIVDCLKKHQSNDSKWFLKTDFSGFFPNTTLNFTMRMLSKVYPLSALCGTATGYMELVTALSLGFLNGGLPQGTKLSPYLTNWIMIPIDFELFNTLAHRHIVYTRYADDMHISAQEKFPWQEVVQIIRDTLKKFGAPYELKDEKTHFGSRAGKNWNLGLMLNKDNDITVGHRTKKYFKASMTNFILDTIHNKPWPIDDVMTLRGKLSYYKMVEPEYFDSIIKHMNEKWNVDACYLMKQYYSL